MKEKIGMVGDFYCKVSYDKFSQKININKENSSVIATKS